MKINESYKPLLKNWLYGIAFYFISFVIGYLAFRSMLSGNVLHTDVDSARYMLSALVQSEAAIVALVVTLSLVAVQLAAQSYSARVIEVFRRTPDLWILMGIYGVAIFYGLGVLKLINGENISGFEIYISGAYYLGVFAFAALVPYMLKMFDMLKPSTVIDMLAERITKENILKTEEWDNPTLPIIDIVRDSMMKCDYETMRDGLNALRERTKHILENETFKEKEEDNISNHIFSHITRIGKLAIENKLDYAAWEVVSLLGELGKDAVIHYPEGITCRVLEYIGVVGTEAAEHRLSEAAQQAVVSIGLRGAEAAELRLENATMYAANSLEQIGKAAANQKLKGVADNVAYHVRWIERAAEKQGLENAKQRIAQIKETLNKIEQM